MSRRPWAIPLNLLYWAGLRTKNLLHAAGILRTRRLQWPVISVGSLSAGGAGKTPVVIALANLLRDQGHAVDVLSRGYGRANSEISQVDLTAPNPAAYFGDEPLLVASSTGVPVWVGSHRYAAGIAAEAASTIRTVHLLDDGFQHRRLARTLDLVLVTAEDLEDVLLPAGNRREPLLALRRADAILLREEERSSVEPRIHRYLRPGAPTLRIRRTLHVSGLPADTDLLAFSGIARPQNFVDMLKACGLRVIDSAAFPDHHRYTASDMRRLAQRLQSCGAQAFITTEKDAVKITPELRATLDGAAPLQTARLQVEFTEPARLLAEVEARCQ